MANPRKLRTEDDIAKLKVSNSEKARIASEQKALSRFEGIDAEPPEYLPTLARAEWLRIMPLLQELPIAELDFLMIASYCQLFAHWRELNDDLNENGQVIVNYDEQGIETSRKINPSFNALMKVQQELRHISGQLGMTINSRFELVTPDEKEEEDEFVQLLKGVK